MMSQCVANWHRERYPVCQGCTASVNRGEKWCMRGNPCESCFKVTCSSRNIDLCPSCDEPKIKKNRQETLNKYLGIAVATGTLEDVQKWIKKGADVNMSYNHRSLLCATKDDKKIDFLQDCMLY